MLLKPLMPEVVKKIFELSSRPSSIDVTAKPTSSIIKIDVATERKKTPAIPIGRQAPAFILLESNFHEYKYPMINEKFGLLLAFAPTLFLPELHTDQGLITLLRREYSSMKAMKMNLVFVTGDMYYSAAEAKIMYDIPFVVLCDPLLSVCGRYIGTNDIGEYLSKPEPGEQQIPSVCSRKASNLGMVLLDKRRNVLQTWCGVTVDGKLNARLIPPSSLDWMRALSNKKRNSIVPPSADISSESAPVQITAEPPEVQEPDVESKVVSKKNILIVDDSNISSKIAAKKIENMGYCTEVAYNGQIAHDKLKADPRKYCLVMLDICMPVCDGMELLKIMKSENSLKHIPVVMLSSLEGADITDSLKKQGALEVMKKPFDESIFLNVLQKARIFNNV